MGKVIVSMEFDSAQEAFKYLHQAQDGGARLVEAVSVPGPAPEAPAVEPAATPAKRGRKPKEKAIEADNSALDAAAASVPAPEKPKEPEAAVPTHADVRAALTEYALTHGKEKAKALLPVGCTNVSSLTVEQCVAVMDAIKAPVPAAAPEADLFD